MGTSSRQASILLGMAMILWGATAPAWAEPNDTSIHVPPGYFTFQPPQAGAVFTDPSFLTKVKRVSDSRNMRGNLAFVSTEYPTAAPFNSNNSRLVLQHQDRFVLYDGNGNSPRPLPAALTALCEPRWSRNDPNVLYYVSANDLLKLDVSTGVSTLVHSFAEYAAIRGLGESDISRDGDHFVFAGDERPGPGGPGLQNRYVFVYTISTDTKGPVLDTSGHAYNSLYITPANGVLIGWLPSGTARFTGVELFDRNLVFQRQVTHALGHMHLTRDTNGDDVLIWTNSNDPQPLGGCPNGIVKVRLANAQQSCLLKLDWSLAVHITAPDGNGWAFVETYAPGDPPPVVPGWPLYGNEILQVKLDGTSTRRLLHHRSRPVNDYGYQPRAAVSRDGTRLAFTSNHNLQAILGYPNEYTDAYLVFIWQGFQEEHGSARDSEGVHPDP